MGILEAARRKGKHINVGLVIRAESEVIIEMCIRVSDVDLIKLIIYKNLMAELTKQPSSKCLSTVRSTFFSLMNANYVCFMAFSK